MSELSYHRSDCIAAVRRTGCVLPLLPRREDSSCSVFSGHSLGVTFVFLKEPLTYNKTTMSDSVYFLLTSLNIHTVSPCHWEHRKHPITVSQLIGSQSHLSYTKGATQKSQAATGWEFFFHTEYSAYQNRFFSYFSRWKIGEDIAAGLIKTGKCHITVRLNELILPSHKWVYGLNRLRHSFHEVHKKNSSLKVANWETC